MKRLLINVALTLIAVTQALGQVKQSNSDEAKIIAQERQSFEAWKNKDRKFFQETTLAEGLFMFSSGLVNKEQGIQLTITPACTVKSYSLDNIKVTMLNKDTALMTYRYTHNTVCSGKPEPSPVWASTVFVKRGKKWMGAFHQETPVAQEK